MHTSVWVREGIDVMLNIELPETQEEVESTRRAGLERTVVNAWNAPFFRQKLEKVGLKEGDVPTEEDWLAIEPTTKEEIRTLSTHEYFDNLVIAKPSDIEVYWRSGGATGRPLFYPRARADFPALVDSFTRSLELAGLREGDLVHNSFPYMGVHPIGHMYGHALHAHGCGNIFAGAGANTPTDVQVQLIFDLKPTVWMGIGSYIIHLGHRAEALGFDPSTSTVKRIISSAEPLTPAKRQRMQEVWGADLFDVYGMTECSLMGGECEVHDGIHIWSDMFLVEILDQETWDPVPPEEVGAVVVTPFHNSSALPFIRWASGDIGSLHLECKCEGPYGLFPRLKLAARTVAFSKVRGVNINHNDMEDLLLSLPVVADYMVTVITDEFRDELRIEIENTSDVDAHSSINEVTTHVYSRFELHPKVDVLPRGTIAKRLETEVKQVRFRDTRREDESATT
jgi:phenylacetate-CoA ligase